LEVHYVLRRKKASPHLSSAITFICGALEAEMNELPADIALIEQRLAEIDPRTLGYDPKYWSNKKAAFRTALLASGLVTYKDVRVNQFTYLSAEWADLESELRTKRDKNGLCQFIRFNNRNGTAPADVSDETIEAFQSHLWSDSRSRDKAKVIRTVTVVWNELRQRCARFKYLSALAVPPRRNMKRLIDFSDFHPSLQANAALLTKWATCADVTSDDVRNDPIGSSTMALWIEYLRVGVTALVATGMRCDQIASLGDLMSVENFDRIMSYQVDSVSCGAPNHRNFYMAWVYFGIARDFLKVPESQLAIMKRVVKAVPAPSQEMTEKNKRLTLKFDDPVIRNRFLTAPDRIWKTIETSTTQNGRRLAVGQAALAIQILTYIPLRLENLTLLEFDKHIFLRPGGTSTLYVPAAETKTERTAEYNIPSPLVERLLAYRDQVAPSVTGEKPKFLFHNADGTNKHLGSVRYLVQAYFKSFVGFHMNPHAFRHLAAKLILDANPGGHPIAQNLLGHKKLSTTVNYYVGTDTKRAGNYHSKLIEDAIDEARKADDKKKGR
jgi:integrase